MPTLRLVEDDIEVEFYTPKTLALRLLVSERTIRRLLAEGELVSYKVAGTRRIHSADVERYLDIHRQQRAS